MSEPSDTPVVGHGALTRRDVLGKLATMIAAATLARWREAAGMLATPLPSGVRMPVPTLPVIGTTNLHFFTIDEKEAIATVADLIIPTDEVSPGARAAGVHEWIDFVVANSPADTQKQWREGLAALDRLALESAGQKFLGLDHPRQEMLLEDLARREVAPETPAERFFALAKEETVNGYYTSEIGLVKDLRYQGGTYVGKPDWSCPAHAQRAE
jgi:gluconate 2-dehydrogenase subunit 3-like protein